MTARLINHASKRVHSTRQSRISTQNLIQAAECVVEKARVTKRPSAQTSSVSKTKSPLAGTDSASPNVVLTTTLAAIVPTPSLGAITDFIPTLPVLQSPTVLVLPSLTSIVPAVSVKTRDTTAIVSSHAAPLVSISQPAAITLPSIVASPMIGLPSFIIGPPSLSLTQSEVATTATVATTEATTEATTVATTVGAPTTASQDYCAAATSGSSFPAPIPGDTYTFLQRNYQMSIPESNSQSVYFQAADNCAALETCASEASNSVEYSAYVLYNRSSDQIYTCDLYAEAQDYSNAVADTTVGNAYLYGLQATSYCSTATKGSTYTADADRGGSTYAFESSARALRFQSGSAMLIIFLSAQDDCTAIADCATGASLYMNPAAFSVFYDQSEASYSCELYSTSKSFSGARPTPLIGNIYLYALSHAGSS